jgi:hypothetical protein
MATTTNSGVGIFNFVLKQGADWSPVITWNDDNGAPLNLTGYHMKMTIRAFAASPIALLTLDSASSTGSRIVLGGTAGTIELIFTHADTAALAPIGLPLPGSPIFGGARVYALGVYDLQFTDPTGEVGYLLEGSVSIDPQVTT